MIDHQRYAHPLNNRCGLWLRAVDNSSRIRFGIDQLDQNLWILEMFCRCRGRSNDIALSQTVTISDLPFRHWERYQKYKANLNVNCGDAVLLPETSVERVHIPRNDPQSCQTQFAQHFGYGGISSARFSPSPSFSGCQSQNRALRSVLLKNRTLSAYFVIACIGIPYFVFKIIVSWIISSCENILVHQIC